MTYQKPELLTLALGRRVVRGANIDSGGEYDSKGNTVGECGDPVACTSSSNAAYEADE